MKTTNLLRNMLLVTVGVLTAAAAQASPAIDTVVVQGFMKKANGDPVTDGTYSLDVGVVQGANTVWAKHFTTVDVKGGVFHVDLTGNGDNIGSGTAFDPTTPGNGNFSAIGFTPAFLNTTTLATSIRIYSNTVIDGVNPQFDFTVGSTPTAFIADTANNVLAQSLSLAAFGTASYTNAGPGVLNQFVLTNASGVVDLTLLPTIPASQVSGLPTSSGNNSYTGDQTFNGNVGVSGTAAFSGPVQISGTGTALVVTHDASVGGNVTVTGGVSATTAGLGVLAVSGTSNFTGNALFNGAVIANGAGWGLQVSHDAVINGNLVTVGTSAFTGNVGLAGNLDVGGVSTLASLGVTNNATVGGTLGVTGASTLASVGVTNNATVGGTLGVTGASTLASLGVTNAATVGGTLGVTGLITASAAAPNSINALGIVQSVGLTSTGFNSLSDTGVTGNLSVTGTSAFGGNSYYAGNLAVAGTTALSSIGVTSVVASGTSAFVGNASFVNNVNILGVLNAGTAALGITTVSGTSAFTAPSAFTSTLTSTGTASLSTVNVTGNTTFAASGTTTFAGPLLLGTPGSAGTVLAFNGSTAAPIYAYKIGGINIVTVASTGTYTPSANLLYAIVEVVGGGGSGGGWITGVKNAGGGGGGGGYIKALCTTAQMGTGAQAVTVGTAVTGTAGAIGTTGNASQFGTASIKLTGNGGGPGAVGVSAVNVAGGAGGTGVNTGAICTTIATIPGANGSASFVPSAANLGFSGAGGFSTLGPGGVGQFGATTVAGTPPTGGFGGGGSGGYNATAVASTGAGGAGTAGMVIITEYLY